jgi:hypothetical protein
LPQIKRRLQVRPSAKLSKPLYLLKEIQIQETSMLTTFLAWAAVGLLARLGLAHVLRQRWKRRWAVSPSLAGAAIYSGGALSAFAMLPFSRPPHERVDW